MNIKFVLAALATGNRGAELGTFLGFLDLPQARTFASHGFKKVDAAATSVLEKNSGQRCARYVTFGSLKNFLHLRMCVLEITKRVARGWWQQWH